MRTLHIGAAAATIAVISLGWLVFQNRGSEKVVTTTALGLAAIFGALVSVLLFGAGEPVHKVFGTTVMIDRASHLPFEPLIGVMAISSWHLLQARDELRLHPELGHDSTDPNASTLYHHLLQRAIVGWLQEKFPFAWQVEVFPLDLGEIRGHMFTSKTVPSKVYSPGDLAKKLSGNKFADLLGPYAKLSNLALPPGSEFIVTPPRRDEHGIETGTIAIKNRFCSITIQTRAAGGLQGIGSYGFIVGFGYDHSSTLWTNQYVVMVDADFRWFLTGNPEMRQYRKWVTDIAIGLESQFDERLVWSRTREQFLFRRAVEAPYTEQPPKSSDSRHRSSTGESDPKKPK